MPSSNLFDNTATWDAETRTTPTTYGRTIPSARWDQVSIARGTRPSLMVFDDTEYRTVDLVFDQPTRSITAEDIRRAYNNLDSRTHIVSTPTLLGTYTKLYTPQNRSLLVEFLHNQLDLE